MTGIRDVQKSAEMTDAWLFAKQKKHMQMIERSIKKLEGSITDSLSLLNTKNGKLIGLKVNLKQAQKIHKGVENLFYNNFSKTTKSIVDNFKDTSDIIQKSFSSVGMAAKFTAVDKEAMAILRDGYYADWLKIGTQQKDKIVQGVYDQVIGGGRFTDLVDTVRNTLTKNVVGIPGASLAMYSTLYARDMIMDYHRNVSQMKAEQLGLKHWLYVGDIIATTRPFCKVRAGKVYTTAQIKSWTFPWAGKKGPALQYCGGWNCRHHWQAVKPEWLDGKNKIDIADWNLKKTKEPIKLKQKLVKQTKSVKKISKSKIPNIEKYEDISSTILAEPKAPLVAKKPPTTWPPKPIKKAKTYPKGPKIKKAAMIQLPPKAKPAPKRVKPIGAPENTAAMKKQIAADPVASGLPEDLQAQYITEKNKYTEMFKDFERRGVRQGSDEWYDKFRSIKRGELDIVYEQIGDWQGSTNGKLPMALKFRAKSIEPKRTGDVFFKRGREYIENDVTQFNKNMKTVQQYIRARAMNQAYMEVKGVRNVTLYRGTDGGTGMRLSDKIVESKGRLNKFNMTDNGLVGYSRDLDTARDFGIDGDGITIRRTYKREDIFFHEDLLSGVTVSYAEEREFIVFSGSFDVPLEDIEFGGLYKF